MGHIVFAAPDLDSFHLHERLIRELRSRGHRSTVLCLDRTSFSFWCAQGIAAVRMQPAGPLGTRAPLATFAEDECRRRGVAPVARRRRRVETALARLLPAVLRWFETDPPDLLHVHQTRTAAHRLLHYVAREFGTRVLWTGEGMLPHTMQIDEEGLDGSARTSRRSAWDFRLLASERPFLDAALAAALGRNVPPSLSRRHVQVPPWRERLLCALADAVAARDLGVLRRLAACRAAATHPPVPRPFGVELPSRPFAAVLLQREDDERLRLDAPRAAPPHVLVAAAQRAIQAVDPSLLTLAVLPRGGLLPGAMARLRRLPGVHLETSDAALDAAVAAVAVVTINAPAAVAGLLAGTPTVHLGSALWGIPGVATPGQLDSLTHDLRQAMRDEQPELQKRFLTWLLRHGHIWCSATDPDFNGLAGLVLEMERRLDAQRSFGGRLQYRAGPAWPLAAEPRR